MKKVSVEYELEKTEAEKRLISHLHEIGFRVEDQPWIDSYNFPYIENGHSIEGTFTSMEDTSRIRLKVELETELEKAVEDYYSQRK